MAAKMEQAKAELEKFLNKKNKFTEYLGILEQKTGVQRLYIFVGGLALLALYLAFGYGAGLICNLIAFVYPAYISIKAVESAKKEDDTQWLTYWVVYACFGTVEFFSDILLSWFPFYYLCKCLFLMYCAAPASWNGSHTIYNRLIRPYFLKYESKLDKIADEVREQATKYVDLSAEKAREMAADAAFKDE